MVLLVLEPAGGVQLLEPRHRLAGHAQVRVAPGGEALAAVDVLLADVHAAGVADLAVDHHDLAVVAVVDAQEVGDVGADLGARPGELLELALLERDASHPVVHDADLDAGREPVEQDRDDLGAESVLLPDEVLQVDEALGGGQVLLEPPELGGAVVVELEGRRRQHPGDVLGGDRAHDRLRDRVAPLLVEARRGLHVARVDGRHLLLLHASQRLDPALAPRHDLPVAAEEDVEEHADERHEDEDEEPGDGDGGLAVVHDQEDDRHHPVDQEDELQPARQQVDEVEHERTLSDGSRAVTPGRSAAAHQNGPRTFLGRNAPASTSPLNSPVSPPTAYWYRAAE